METYVERVLNGEPASEEIDLDSAADAGERFERHAAKRLLRAHALLQQNRKYADDFLLALRDYLLVLHTSIRLDSIAIREDNPYGISREASTGRYFASYQLPEYATASFVDAVFSHPIPEAERISACLATDPRIEQLTGYSKFKTLAQKLSVYGALNTPEGYTTLVALPTGGGKSLVTQTLAYQREGLTIVIVPTVSLAIDQVRTARKTIRREHVEQEILYYSSGMDQGPILKAIESHTARLLFISPETLMLNPAFQASIQAANAQLYLKNIIIDEAHIVVDWGASFRIEYQCLESWREKLLSKNPGIRTILLSATFEKRCVEILRALFSRDDRWIEVRCDALRHEPRFMLVNARSNDDKRERMLELVRKLPHPMIIYVAKPDEAELLKEYLAKHGLHNVETFTGTTSSAKRKKRIDDWVGDRFQIMIATSAFGVGVDKGDVRTVLHMYVPQNANAYYQELGRGGRDGLPCLSAMCIHNDDVNAAFQRINKRVMTVDKLMGRWNSMFNNERSVRKDTLVYIDTSIKPGYSDSDELDDSPTSDADRNWNIYVLLFLRRRDMIRIRDVIWDRNRYVFVIEIVSGELLEGGDPLRAKLEKFRQEEWESYYSAYENMRRSVHVQKRSCWSEMFFDTYEYVGAYCAGCRSHLRIENESAADYPLKRAITAPARRLEADQLEMFGGAMEMVVIAKPEEQNALLAELLQMRLNVLVLPDGIERIPIVETGEKHHLFIISRKDLAQLMKGDNLYYGSGLVAVIYEGTEQEILSEYRTVKSSLLKHAAVRVVHILREDVWFERYNRRFSDWVDGKVLRAADIRN